MAGYFYQKQELFKLLAMQIWVFVKCGFSKYPWQKKKNNTIYAKMSESVNGGE